MTEQAPYRIVRLDTADVRAASTSPYELAEALLGVPPLLIERQPIKPLPNARSIADDGTARASPVNVPCCAISVAAAMNPVHAARANAPPTLMRRTPIAASCSTVAKSPPTSTFTGFGATASTTALMSSMDRRPGA